MLISFLLALAFWAAALWPAPKFLFSGIPNGTRPEKYGGREMAPGDPLQLLYHFNLARQAIAGRIPLFHDVYEFNTGDDRDCRSFDSYYIPFSLLHAAAAPISEAFGYQLAGFFSLWMSCLFMWLLARRFVGGDFLPAVAALAGMAFPYRVMTFLMGSPTGFGICWVPLLLYGLDCAIRDGSWKGGLAAGLAVFAAAMGDLHVFYFSVIAMPAWAILVWLVGHGPEWKSPDAWRRLGLALIPFLLFLAISGLYAWGFSQAIGESGMARGRTWGEIRNFSPTWTGFFDPGASGLNSQVYLGRVLVAAVACGWCLGLARYRWFAGPERRAFWMLTVLCLGGVAMAFLALGPRGPWHGRLFELCRRTIPMYTMIRQPAKVFALMPALAALALAFSVGLLWIRVQNRTARRVVLCALGLAVVFDYCRNIRPAFCILKPDRGAYHAAAEDAAKDSSLPRALVVPLWPGDSHYASVYLHHAMHSGVRMLNGYAPKIRRGYFEDVFKRYESVNSGWLDDAQAQSLLSSGVRYIILHEDLFPEKVSPFPSAFTLHRFLNHPRLRLLAQDETIWTFRLLERPEPGPAMAADWDVFFPALRKDTLLASADGKVQAGRGGGAVIVLDAPGAGAVTARGVALGPGVGFQWLLRAQGQGRVSMAAALPDRTLEPVIRPCSSDWRWLKSDFRAPEFGPFRLSVALDSGVATLDSACLLAGDWTPPGPGSSISFPAALFFHSGHTDLAGGGVCFRRMRDAEGPALYGPRLPFEPGRYRVFLDVETDAPAGVILGRVRAQWNDREERPWIDLAAGRHTRLDFTQEENLPVTFVFAYSREADMRINRIAFARLP